MHTHAEKRIVPHTAQQMFDLVVDIEKYPEFLPWCNGARILKHKDETIVADVSVGYKFIRDTFTSRVTYKSPHRINVKYEKGPFRYLNNHWRFRDLKNGKCEIDFYIDFAFHNSLFQQPMKFFFNELVSIMINAFEARAKAMYDTKG